jgi:DNA polymerase-1
MVHLRVAAKNVVFGYAYGRGAAAICRQAKEEGVNITIDEAQALIDGLVAQYPYLPIFFDQCRERTHNQMYIINCYGRARRFRRAVDRKTQGDMERQAMNFTMQSFVADAMSRALDHLYTQRSVYGLNYKIALQIHDAVLLEVPCNEAERVIDEVLPDCMVKRVDVRPCDLDGVPLSDKIYHLGIDVKTCIKWGEAITEEDGKIHGVPERFIKKKK